MSLLSSGGALVGLRIGSAKTNRSTGPEQPPDPRAPHRDRPITQTQPPRLAVAVAITTDRIDPGAPLVPAPAQALLDLVLQHLLQQPLDPLPGERLQRLPHRP